MNSSPTFKQFTEKYSVDLNNIQKHEQSAFGFSFEAIEQEGEGNMYFVKVILMQDDDHLQKSLDELIQLQGKKVKGCLLFNEYFISTKEDKFGLALIIIQEYFENNLQKDIQHRSEDKELLEQYNSPDAFKILHNVINTLELFQKNQIMLEYLKPSNFHYKGKTYDFWISGVVESVVFRHSKDNFYDKSKIYNCIERREPKKPVIAIDPMFSKFMGSESRTKYKLLTLDCCRLLVQVFTLGLQNDELYDEIQLRQIIDSQKCDIPCELLGHLHLISSDTECMRSDFITLKKIKDKPMNQKSRDYKLERIINEEELAYDDKKSMSSQIMPVKKFSFDNMADMRLMNEVQENPKDRLFKEFTIREDPNFNHRPYMEDYTVFKKNVIPEKSSFLFAVFDGHGGDKVARGLVDLIPDEISKTFQENPTGPIEKTMEQIFERVDEQILTQDPDIDMGSTCCLVMLFKEKEKRSAIIANIGDSRAVLVNRHSTHRISYDHKVSDPDEQERIKKENGQIIQNRINGQLAVARAFGDSPFKGHGLCVKPYVNTLIDSDLQDGRIVIASDGLWDVLTDQEAQQICFNPKFTNSDEICESLMDTAMKKGTRDNTSIIVIIL